MKLNPLEIMGAEEFRRRLAQWVLENSRTAQAADREDFLEAYRVPPPEWELCQSYVGQGGRVFMHFRAVLRLLSCQTRDGKAPRELVLWQIRAREPREGAPEEIIGYGIG
ncbi:MAG: hypothetical protein LBQ80_03420 [Clostridium sp.]|jgi:hypothetical protein|nr:hypothetical protein [Clostridium sp.]